jgi:hypothetical protein
MKNDRKEAAQFIQIVNGPSRKLIQQECHWIDSHSEQTEEQPDIENSSERFYRI